ncbi:FecR family protein [Novosphingobium sp. 11B]
MIERTDGQLAAAMWVGVLEGGADERTRARFEKWRGAQPGNGEAFDRMSDTHARLSAVAEVDEILSLRQETLARVVARRKSRTAVRVGLAVSLVVGALVYGVHSLHPGRAPQLMADASAPVGELFATAVGERMTITLQDGSKISLNTATRMRIAYGPSERHITLESGQAWFEVAHDRRRPFRVLAGGQRIEAHGTAFDVRTAPGRTEVMLAQGRVTVESTGQNGVIANIAMNPRELLVASSTGVSVRHVGDLGRWQSWREGRVLLDNVPLSDAIAEMNRYTSIRLVAADERTARIRMSGSFNAGATQAFLEALAYGFRIDSRQQDPNTIVLHRKWGAEKNSP